MSSTGSKVPGAILDSAEQRGDESGTCGQVPYSLHHAHAIADSPKDCMLAVQPGRHSQCDEELRTQVSCEELSCICTYQ